MSARYLSRSALLAIALLCTGCRAESSSAAEPNAGATRARTGTDAGAMADLQTSSEWTRPRCRWLETGAWVLAYPQETALYEAARDLGYIEMTHVGMGNRIRPEPAWKIALTDAGTAESARCGRGSSKPQVWGVPVSQRRFISGRRIAEPDLYHPDRTMFEVEFEWVPTPAGDRVKYVLTNKMAVEQGIYRTKVALRYGDRAIGRGTNGWQVDQIYDLASVAR